MTRSTFRLPLLLLPLLLLLGLGDAQAQRKVAAKAKKATTTKVRSTRSSKAKSSAAKSSRSRKATTSLIKGKSGAKTKTTSLKAASAKSKTTAKSSTKKGATKSLAKSSKSSSSKKGSTAAKSGKSAKSAEAQKRASGSTGGKKTASSSSKKSSSKKKSDAEIRDARKAAASKGKGKSKGTAKTRTAATSKSTSSTRSSSSKSTASASKSRSSSKTAAKTTTKGKKLTQAQREGLAAQRVAKGGEVLSTTPFNGDINNPITGLGPVEVVVRHGTKSKGPLTFMQRLGRFFSPSYERKYMVMVNADGSTMKLSSRPNAPFFRAFHGLMNALPLRELAHDVLHSKGVREGIFTAALGGAATTVTPVGSVGIYRGAQQMIEGVKRRRDARNQVFDKTVAWAKSQGKKGNYPNLANAYRHYKMELQRNKPGTHPATLRNFAEQLAAVGL